MAKGVSIDLIVDPKGAIEGLNVASDEAKKSTSFFSDLGKIGATAVAAVATAAVAAAGALTAATVSAGKYADEILETATNTNLSTDTLQAYKYAAEQIDVSFETFTASQGKLVKSMQAAREGTGGAADAFAALGLSVTDSEGNLVDSTELYWQAVDALGNVSNETERTALAQQIFGKSGAEMNAIIAKGSEGFAALTEEARKNGAIMSGEQLEKLGAFDDKMQALTSTVEAAKNAFGLTLLPILDQLAGEGTSALGEFTTALLEADGDLSKAGPAFEALGTNIASALTNAVPKILEVATSLVSGLISGIVSQGPKLIETAIPLISNFAIGILAMLPKIINAGFTIVVAVIQGVTNALPTLLPAIVSNLVEGLLALFSPRNLTALLDAGLALLMGLVEGILTALPILVEALPEIIDGIVTFFVDNLPKIIQTGIDLFLAIIGALPDIISGIVDAIPEIIEGIISALITSIPQLIQAGVQLFVALISNLPTIIIEIIKAIPAIVTGIVNAFTDPKTIAQLAKAGGELIKGLWNGIKDLGKWLWDKISGFFGGVVKNIKSFFGIKSPSTLFAGFGEFMVLGLEKGLTGPNHLKGIMANLSGQVTNGFRGDLAATARATVTTSASLGEAVREDSAFTADPKLHTLVRTLISAVSEIQPGWIVPEQLSRISQTGNGRLAAIGAT